MDDWWVRPRRNELERADEVVRIEARSMAVLVCLAELAPKTVSKDLLLEIVWSDSPHIGEEVISHAIWELRKAFGDSARDPTYIQTVTRKGYRLLKDVVRPSGSALPMEGVRLGRYEIGKELGQGAMGMVYEALDTQLERPVAIKFLAPELTRDTHACRRFEREARLAASLDHPNLATVHEIGETSRGQRFLVTPLYSGGSLKEKLAKGPIPLDEAVESIRQLAAGLSAAHASEIVHRDIKPANLLFDRHGTLKVADFGIAKLIGSTDLTSTGAALGTPAYKSPEQSRGETVDHRTDIWSIGVVLFELLTGRRPFDGEYEHAVVHAILEKDPEPLEDLNGEPIPDSLRAIVAKAMAKDPADRYQSVSELMEALASPTPTGVDTRILDEPDRALPSRVGMVGASIVLALLVSVLWQYRQTETDAISPGTISPDAISPDTISPDTTSSDTISQAARAELHLGKKFWLRGNAPEYLREAEKHFRNAVALAPDWAEAHGHLVVLLADIHALSPSNPEKKVAVNEALGQAFAADQDHPLVDIAKARIALVAGDLLRAAELASRARDQQPECGPEESCDLAYVWLAEAQWRLGSVEAAFETLEACFEVGQGQNRCRLKRAQLYEGMKEYDRAVLDYRMVLEWEPGQTTALNDLCTVYLIQGDEGAGSCLRRHFDLTNDPVSGVNLAHFYFNEERWHEAREQYLRAHALFVEADRLIPTPYIGVGDVYLMLEQPENARLFFRKALSIFERMTESTQLTLDRQGQWAVCMAKAGRVEESLAAIEALLPQAGKEANLWFYAARIHAVLDNEERLIELARKAIEADIEPYRLKDDAAFRDYKNNPRYLSAIEGAWEP